MVRLSTEVFASNKTGTNRSEEATVRVY